MKGCPPAWHESNFLGMHYLLGSLAVEHINATATSPDSFFFNEKISQIQAINFGTDYFLAPFTC